MAPDISFGRTVCDSVTNIALDIFAVEARETKGAIKNNVAKPLANKDFIN